MILNGFKAEAVALLAIAGVVLAYSASAFPALLPLPREVRVRTGGCPATAEVRERREASLPREGYVIDVTEGGVEIVSVDAAGAFYARETLRQLAVVENGRTNYPCCTIRDWPAYRWRGVLIDDSRHFFGRETVERVIDQMSRYKLNVLHWHLTDDQGWRIDVPGLPELARRGSVRASSPRHGAELAELGGFRYRSEQNGQVYGPFFYTEADLRDIVRYAAKRHVTIVPEIDLPGHMRAAIAAYPSLTCFPQGVTNRMAHSDWGVATEVLCVGNDEVLRFLEKVMDFVCDVFPGEVVHIGGDECPRINWERCPKCRRRMEAEGLKDSGELQAWITCRMAACLKRKGRRIIGWDEILAGSVPLDAIGQSWRTREGNGAGTAFVRGSAGAARGHDMVISPHTECYYNYPQGLEDDPFQYAGIPLPLERAYAFDPMRGVDVRDRARILGSEACLWSEYVWNEYDLEWKMWPRALAMAEILWSSPEPRDYGDFLRRARIHRSRLVRGGVNSAPVCR